MICVFKNTVVDQVLFEMGKVQPLYVNVYRNGSHSYAIPYKSKTLQSAPPRPEYGRVEKKNQRGQSPVYRIKVTIR